MSAWIKFQDQLPVLRQSIWICGSSLLPERSMFSGAHYPYWTHWQHCPVPAPPEPEMLPEQSACEDWLRNNTSIGGENYLNHARRAWHAALAWERSRTNK